MKNKFKIRIIIPYWGKWPAWFHYFLYSCKFNPEIDWLFFSDCGPLPLQNKNLELIKMSLQEFNLLATRKLQLPIAINHPYKICDFKPAYGKIFEDYLSNYEFWGYGDVDMIYGNIKAFITNKILNDFDIITFHKTFMPGHLCLLRNKEFVNQLFKKSNQWQFVFTNNKMNSFSENFSKSGINTESGYLENETRKKVNKHLIKRKILSLPIIQNVKLFRLVKRLIFKHFKNAKPKDFNEIVDYFENTKTLSVYRKTLYKDDIMYLLDRNKHWEVHWINGNLFQESEEIVYFHFQLAKYRNQIEFIDEREKKSSFRIIKV